MKKIIALFSLVLICFSCDVAQSLVGTYSLTQCEYKYGSISNLSLAGFNLQNTTSLSSMNPLTAAGLLAAFSNSKNSLPLQFTLNMNVKNPNTQTAILNGLQYVLSVDNVQMTTGSVDSRMQIATGQTAQIPINIAFDLKKVMTGESSEAVKNMAYNIIGLGSNPSNITVKLRPTLDINGQLMQSPVEIPVTFQLKR